MIYSSGNLAELNILMSFSSPSGLEGIKIHKTAEAEVITAASRLFDQGLLTQVDGGYLTPFGIEAAEHAHKLFAILNGSESE